MFTKYVMFIKKYTISAPPKPDGAEIIRFSPR